MWSFYKHLDESYIDMLVYFSNGHVESSIFSKASKVTLFCGDNNEIDKIGLTFIDTNFINSFEAVLGCSSNITTFYEFNDRSYNGFDDFESSSSLFPFLTTSSKRNVKAESVSGYLSKTSLITKDENALILDLPLTDIGLLNDLKTSETFSKFSFISCRIFADDLVKDTPNSKNIIHWFADSGFKCIATEEPTFEFQCITFKKQHDISSIERSLTNEQGDVSKEAIRISSLEDEVAALNAYLISTKRELTIHRKERQLIDFKDRENLLLKNLYREEIDILVKEIEFLKVLFEEDKKIGQP